MKLIIKKLTSTLLKTCSFLLMKTIPPLKNAQPRTRSMFDKIDPSNDCWTTRNIPFLRAWIDMINSVAFPKVAFRRPPTACAKWQSSAILLDLQ